MTRPNWRAWIPRSVARAAGRLRASRAHVAVVGELRNLARGTGPIIAGPWLGEVGFEILYWLPFLRWAIAEHGLDPARIVAVSRGRPVSWYQRVAGQYADILECVTAEQFREGNERRHREIGEQKQLFLTPFEKDILSAVRREKGLDRAAVIHPALMYRLYRPYWWKHVGLEWMRRHALYWTIPKPSLPPEIGLKPGSYVAAKVYFNDCLHDSAAVRRRVAGILKTLADIGPVVSLGVDLELDDHVAVSGSDSHVMTLGSIVTPQNNLEIQSAVVANAWAFVGTYGGFSYVAPFYQVPAVALFEDEQGFDRSHLRLMESVLPALGGVSFTPMNMASLSDQALITAVRGPALAS